MSQGSEAKATGTGAAARKRAAVEMIARYEGALRRTARRYSFDAEDADDAYQRALEIVLTKAPTTDLRELIRWTQTVTKHEALAVRQSRQKLLGYQSARDGVEDPMALIPAAGDGPDEQVERREDVARSREALQALKPAELRALGLLAEGYSYVEIGERTGWSQTKINRLLAEGRSRFRAVVSSSEDGSRCRELRPLLSAFCDGETSPREAVEVREHLRACAQCRATMRAYKAAPGVAAAALLPMVPPARSLLERAQDLASSLSSRLPGFGNSESVATQVAAAGGTRGAGMAAIAKLLTVCAGAAGGAAACVATGVLPAPVLSHDATPKSALQRPAASAAAMSEDEAVDYQPAPEPTEAQANEPEQHPATKKKEAAPSSTEPSAATSGAVEYEAPAPVPEPTASDEATPVESSSSSGSAAGEFGP